MNRIATWIAFSAALPALAAGTPKLKGEWSVIVSPAFINPTLGQAAVFEIKAPGGGKGSLHAEVLDRDRFVIRRLPDRSVDLSRPVKLSWDGRDDAGQVVPNDAYTLRLTVGSGHGGLVYDPSDGFVPVVEPSIPCTYSATSGILSYTLARPARVHIQAGQARPDPVTKVLDGPILKTVVDREPRTAGPIAESWSGFDESGKIPVASLPNFVVSVYATSLPPASVITVGSRGPTLREYARKSRATEHGYATATPAAAGEHVHRHHTGLTVFDDVSPQLQVRQLPTEATSAVRLQVRPEIVEGSRFSSLPAKVRIFVDQELLATYPAHDPLEVTVDATKLGGGPHRIVVNWGTDVGPVGVGTLLMSSPVVPVGKGAAR